MPPEEQGESPLQVIGQLAGGIAHDFNNILGVIINYARFAQGSVPPGSPAAADIEEIRRAAERGVGLVRQLMILARRESGATVVFDLNELIAGLDGFLRSTIGEHITVERRLAPDLWPLADDPARIEQILINLAVNARDAMPGGGTLAVSTRNIAGGPGSVGPAGVELSVSDTGAGMDDATLARIFEPFFTTKPTGKGTGMGLATVYGIVKQSGGDIRVRSAPGAGSTFTIVLPPEAAAAAGDAVVSELAPRGSERILLVDDETLVRELTARMLRALGYRVDEVGDPAAAMARWSAEPGGFDLLVTDVVLPNMSGRELADALAREGGGPKVLYMSGYTDDAVLQHGVATEAMPFLQKPFTSADLAVAVRSLLDAPRSAS
jgi:CheY-like chemotaxis protein